jgi:hypothetical protein
MRNAASCKRNSSGLTIYTEVRAIVVPSLQIRETIYQRVKAR